MKFRVYNYFHPGEEYWVELEEASDCPVCTAISQSTAESGQLLFIGVDNWLGRPTTIRRVVVVTDKPMMLVDCREVSPEDAAREHNASCCLIH